MLSTIIGRFRPVKLPFCIFGLADLTVSKVFFSSLPPRKEVSHQDRAENNALSFVAVLVFAILNADRIYKSYSPEEYPHFDNYNAIEVSKTAEIPYDYDGFMGVPITFMDKYNPDQFEIIGATESEGKGFSNGLWKEESKVAQPLVAGEKKYKRIFIKKR